MVNDENDPIQLTLDVGATLEVMLHLDLDLPDGKVYRLTRIGHVKIAGAQGSARVEVELSYSNRETQVYDRETGPRDP